MSSLSFASPKTSATPIWLVNKTDWAVQVKNLPAPAQAFAKASGFTPDAGKHLVTPDETGGVSGVIFAVDDPKSPDADPFLFGKLPTVLPAGTYKFATAPQNPALAALAWLLGSYTFAAYKKKPATAVKLVPPKGIDADETMRIATAATLARDLINTPTEDLGPDGIEAAAERLAKKYDAKFKTVEGKKLLEKNFPLIHAVGRASSVQPRLIELVWGKKGAPLVTLVGKGVAFDTGGLDIKPSSSMALMKKDMGGAATTLALADMIMGAKLPIRLCVLIPAVENSIAGNSFRPGDIFKSRKGITVEIGNTDAEGRLILADALAYADEDKPDLLIDFATLTGAARVALGPDLPPFYTKDDKLAGEIAAIGGEINDPVWRMPLWSPYLKQMDSDCADINNASSVPFAGSVTAALFLHQFVEAAKAYVHFDIYAWSPTARPGRPKGADLQAARLVYELLKRRYAGKA